MLSWNSQFFTKETLNSYFTLVTKYVAILPGHVSFSHPPAMHGTFAHSSYLGPSALDPALLQAWIGFQLWALLLGFRAALTWPALTPGTWNLNLPSSVWHFKVKHSRGYSLCSPLKFFSLEWKVKGKVTQLFLTLQPQWTQSMEFYRTEYWSG